MRYPAYRYWLTHTRPTGAPLPGGLALALREYLKGRPANRPVWPGTWSERSADMLKIDLEVALQIHSPYDVEARFSTKREILWAGYKVHLTETCDEDTPHLVTQVESTTATRTDYDTLPPIQQDLARALDLLKSMNGEEERERAAVYMDGLAQRRADWKTREQKNRKI